MNLKSKQRYKTWIYANKTNWYQANGDKDKAASLQKLMGNAVSEGTRTALLGKQAGEGRADGHMRQRN